MEFGVDFLREFKAGGQGDYAGALLTRDSLLRAIPDIRNPKANDTPLPPLQGLNIYGEISDGVSVFVRALEKTQAFKVLSRPSIYAANNKKAVITSGRRIPVPTSSVSDLDNSNSIRTNIAFQDVVLKLEVIPLINSNKEVSLTIAQVNDTVVGQQVVADNTVPIIGTERLVTTVTVANRATIVLGGLITENEEKTNTGVPVLSRIPMVGNLFKSSKTVKTRKELIIFIQPVVVEDGAEVDAASLQEDLRSQVGAAAAAAFPEFVPEFIPETPPSPETTTHTTDAPNADTPATPARNSPAPTTVPSTTAPTRR